MTINNFECFNNNENELNARKHKEDELRIKRNIELTQKIIAEQKQKFNCKY